MNVAVDVGNSSIKWAVIPDLANLSIASEWQLQRWHKRMEASIGHMPPSTTWWISSVNQSASDRIAKELESLRPTDKLRFVHRDGLELSLNVDRPDQVGLDRLMSALAVSYRCQDNESAISVDFGTATTINLVDGNRTFHGGLILPGIQTQLDALTNATDQLPSVEWRAEESYDQSVGKNTQDAILNGTIRGHLAAVESLTSRIQSEVPNVRHVWCTGGGVPTTNWCASIGATVVPHLVLEGIGRYAAYQSESHRGTP